MKIPDVFIEDRANEYVKCVVKPFPKFEQYLWYIWDYYNKRKLRKNNWH